MDATAEELQRQRPWQLAFGLVAVLVGLPQLLFSLSLAAYVQGVGESAARPAGCCVLPSAMLLALGGSALRTWWIGRGLAVQGPDPTLAAQRGFWRLAAVLGIVTVGGALLTLALGVEIRLGGAR